MQKKNYLKKYGKYVVLFLLVATMAVSGISAYFTATDTVTNNFDVREVNVELQEPNWAPDLDTDGDGIKDAVSDITPNETVAKNPTVKNIGTTDQYVFMKVTVPYKNIVTADLEGIRNDAADTELFTWNTNDAEGNLVEAGILNAEAGDGTGAINSGWTLLPGYTTVDSANGVVEYIYAYGSATQMTALAPETLTPALFNSITMCNAVEDQGLENKVASVVIDVYAIQTSDLGDGATKVPTEVLNIYLNQNETQESGGWAPS